MYNPPSLEKAEGITLQLLEKYHRMGVEDQQQKMLQQQSFRDTSQGYYKCVKKFTAVCYRATDLCVCLCVRLPVCLCVRVRVQIPKDRTASY